MADSNFQQFAARGNPWVSPKTWDRELRDAGNPRCATARRNSAIEFVASPKSHNMRFPEPQENLTGHIREGVTDTARVLAARNRIREIRTVPETVVKHYPAAVAVKVDAETVAERKRRSGKIAYYANFVNPKRPNPHITAVVIFRNYSEIVSLFGSIEGYLNYG